MLFDISVRKEDKRKYYEQEITVNKRDPKIIVNNFDKPLTK